MKSPCDVRGIETGIDEELGAGTGIEDLPSLHMTTIDAGEIGGTRMTKKRIGKRKGTEDGPVLLRNQLLDLRSLESIGFESLNFPWTCKFIYNVT